MRRARGLASRVAVMVLGLLSEGERHGYGIARELEERGMLRWSKASKVGIYKALARLQEEGCLTSWREKEGRQPERRVYALTAAGEERLRELVFTLCASREPLRLESAVGVAFIDLLERGDALEALRQRKEFLSRQSRRLASEAELLQGLAAERHLDVLARERSAYRSELRWLEGIISAIEGASSAAP